MSVETLVARGLYTPQQLITDLQNRVDGITELAVVMRLKSGHIKPALTTMSLERALTMYAVGVNHTVRKLQGTDTINGTGGAA